MTKNGAVIQKFAHKVDFVWMDVLNEFGGIYMDTNIVILRDITDLRHIGFANIFGEAISLTMKNSGYFNNGVIMSAPGTVLIEIYV
jgi:mannosyltransferase OCH1-like enzyme